MGKVLDGIDDQLRTWLQRQPVWFVATAPLAADGLINVSPKGGSGLFRVLSTHQVAYVDLFGSGIETVAHLRENGRIVLMFAAFEGAPRIIRLHGMGRVIHQHEQAFDGYLAEFEVDQHQQPAVRSVIDVTVSRVSTSCGFVVSLIQYTAERNQLYRFADKRLEESGPDAIHDYCDVNNSASIDGLPGLDRFGGPLDASTRARHQHEGRVL